MTALRRDTLNPFTSTDDNEFITALFLYDSLFDRNGQNEVIPALAVEAEPASSGNASVWNVKLQPDVTFHDGSPLTADDVIWTFKYLRDPKNKAIQAASLSAVKDVTKVSKHELRFQLSRAIGDFKGYLASPPPFPIVRAGASSLDTAANGTGPFKLKSYNPGQRTEFVRNDSYWGEVYLDEAAIVPIPDSGQRMNALLSGTVDVVFLVDFVQAKAQKNNKSVRFVSKENTAMTSMFLQIDSPEFSDERVRRALKLSINRPETIERAVNGFGTVGNDVNGKGYASYNTDLAQHEYDPEQAKALLKAAGKSDLAFTLYSSKSGPGMLESATVWKQQAKDAGININLQQIPADTYYSNNKYLKVPAYQVQWNGYSFESWAPQALFKDAPYNETHWFRPEWEARFKKAQSIVDDTDRNAIYKELQVPIWDEGGYILWGFQPTLNAVGSRIQGARPWSFLNVHPQDWWVK